MLDTAIHFPRISTLVVGEYTLPRNLFAGWELGSRCVSWRLLLSVSFLGIGGGAAMCGLDIFAYFFRFSWCLDRRRAESLRVPRRRMEGGALGWNALHLPFMFQEQRLCVLGIAFEF